MADRVRVKMFLAELRYNTYGGGVTLQVVTRGEDNKAWAAATPSGEMKLSIKNELALEFFRDMLGKEFFIDVIPVPEAHQGEEGMG
mgnify:FL=1